MKLNLNISKLVNLKKEIAKKKNLAFVDTTSQRNGYPSDTSKALVGFSSLDSADNFAKRYGLETVLLYSKDGWNFWARLSHGLWKELDGKRGGKVMSVSEDTNHYMIGVSF
jgi:hypothetical protein